MSFTCSLRGPAGTLGRGGPAKGLDREQADVAHSTPLTCLHSGGDGGGREMRSEHKAPPGPHVPGCSVLCQLLPHPRLALCSSRSVLVFVPVSHSGPFASPGQDRGRRRPDQGFSGQRTDTGSAEDPKWSPFHEIGGCDNCLFTLPSLRFLLRKARVPMRASRD